MKKIMWAWSLGVVFLLFSGCSGMKFGSRMQYALDTSAQLNQSQPAPEMDIPVPYHGADFLRFFDERHLLVGSVTFDVAGTPEYGPIILYDLQTRTEKWRIPRDAHYAARHQLLAFNPQIILRSVSQGKVVHTAYAPDSGRRLWLHQTDDKSIRTYRLSSSMTMTDLYILSDGVLNDIDLRTGAVKWETGPLTLETKASRPKLIALENILFLVSGDKISAYGLQDGRLAWDRPNPLGAETRVLSGADGIF